MQPATHSTNHIQVHLSIFTSALYINSAAVLHSHLILSFTFFFEKQVKRDGKGEEQTGYSAHFHLNYWADLPELGDSCSLYCKFWR